MSRYLEILALQSPFTIGTDDNNRTMFSMNFEAMVAGVVDWEGELSKLLSDAGLGTLGVDIFWGPAAVIPTGSGPYTLILTTAGRPPAETHNGDLYERLAAQIIVRGSSYGTARTRARAVWLVLHGQRNVTVTS